MRILFAPDLTQRPYLGMDFWKLFGLAPQMIDALDLKLGTPSPIPVSHNFTPAETEQITSVVNTFPSFIQQGLGKTDLLSHKIQVIKNTSTTNQNFTLYLLLLRNNYTK